MEPLYENVPDRVDIESDALILRCPRATDAAALNAAIQASIDELRPYMVWAQTLPTLAQSEAECRRLQASYLLRTGLPMLIFERDAAGNEGALIGGAGLHRIDWTVRRFEIGYWCRSDRQRRGHVTDAVRMLSRFAFETLQARRVEIRMDADNVRSWRVAERAGYQLEGVLRSESLTPTGQARDTRVYARVAPSAERV